MNSLTAHLTGGTSHGRLSFRPDCPICVSQRLSGPTPELTLPVRAQARVLATAIAAGTLLPTASLAASPVAPGPRTAQSSENPTLVADGVPPGGDETGIPPTDEAPDLRDVLTNPDAGTDSDGEDVGAEEDVPEPAPPATPLAEPPVDEPTAPVLTAPAPPTPAPPAPPPTAPQPPSPPAQGPSEPRSHQVAQSPGSDKGRVRHAPRRRPHRQSNAETSPGPVLPVASPDPPRATAAASPRTVAVVTASRTGPISTAVYTVRPGDSLWSIARRLIGTNATNGRIAKQVTRIWQLNRERIGTGDPNLLHVGTQLRLR
ncbi:MAG: hypothetical protein QOD71_458 [Thermoleophilaceae bacterium]|nr:hypothetical protein [Thermoleophilaceae bacterium]